MMASAELLGLVVLVAYSQVLMRKQARSFEDRLRAQDEAEEGRKLATYKMAKANERVVARSDKAVRQMADQARNLHENARLMQDRAETMLKEARDGQ